MCYLRLASRWSSIEIIVELAKSAFQLIVGHRPEAFDLPGVAPVDAVERCDESTWVRVVGAAPPAVAFIVGLVLHSQQHHGPTPPIAAAERATYLPGRLNQLRLSLLVPPAEPRGVFCLPCYVRIRSRFLPMHGTWSANGWIWELITDTTEERFATRASRWSRWWLEVADWFRGDLQVFRLVGGQLGGVRAFLALQNRLLAQLPCTQNGSSQPVGVLLSDFCCHPSGPDTQLLGFPVHVAVGHLKLPGQRSERDPFHAAY